MGGSVVGGHHRGDRLGHRGGLLPGAGSSGLRHRPGSDRGSNGLRRGSLAGHDPRGAGRVPPRPGGRTTRPGRGHRADLAPGVRCARGRRRDGAAGIAGTYEEYADLAGTFPFEERAQPSAGRVRSAGSRAGGRGRRDHPVERPDRAHHLQARSGPPRRVHRRPQVLARGSGRRLRRRRDRRGDRVASRSAQRRHRRSGSL